MSRALAPSSALRSTRRGLSRTEIMPSVSCASTILRRLLLALLLGLATTFALAWLLAAFLPHARLTRHFNLVGEPGVGPPGSSRGLFIAIDEFWRPGMVRRAWVSGITMGATSLTGDLGPGSTIALHLKTARQDRTWGSLGAALAKPTITSAGAEDARGWPLLCLWCTLDETAITGGTNGPPVRGGLPLSRPSNLARLSSFRALPLMPIWRGLAADTAIHAGAWLVAIPVFIRIRAVIRGHRGLCPACAYDLQHRHTDGCPECGWNRRPSAAA